jgi:IS30 family transposase
MDTVKGKREKSKVMLTMAFRKSHFMLIFLMHDGTQQSVLAIFDYLTDLLGLNLFRRLFPIILTDNGVEFKDPNSLEYSTNGCPRTRVFFCDPQASWQKPLIENTHRFIRRIVPKSVSFNTLSKEDPHLIVCHINSVLREQLQDQTPFDLMQSEDEKKLLSCLNLQPIPPDEVILRPTLINH